MPLSPEEKVELLREALHPLIDQFRDTWMELKAKGVDYDSYIKAVWLFFVLGVKNLSHHPSHVMMFLQILAHELPQVQLAVRADDDDDEADA